MWATKLLVLVSLPFAASGADGAVLDKADVTCALSVAKPGSAGDPTIAVGTATGAHPYGLLGMAYEAAQRWEMQAAPHGIYNEVVAAILRNAPLARCYAPGTDPEVMDEYDYRMHLDPGPLAYFLGGRWSGSQGSPRALTWSFVPDGLSAEGSNSNLFARMNSLFGGDTQAWISLFQQCFDRWEELTGTSYTRITVGGNEWDDGASWGSAGSATRGDIRIAMGTIDGGGGVLAFNYFPSNGDMFIDFAENWGSNSNNWRFLRDVVMHEHGHGIGMSHVCSSNSQQLMEPFINTSFDGPQHDDLRGAQRHYGDPFEPDNDVASATVLGTVTFMTPLLSPQIPAPSISNSSLTSIDATGEEDWFRFSVSDDAAFLSVTLTPRGFSYDSSPQSGSTCTSGHPIDSLTMANLDFEVYDTDGTTVLARGTGSPAGQTESVSDVSVTGPADYYIRVYSTGSQTEPQFYDFEISAVLPGACCLADGSCISTREIYCNVEPGFFQGDGTTCPPEPACVPVDTLMSCELESITGAPGSSVRLNLYVEEVTGLGAYQAALAITRTSGTGTVSVSCPDGARVNEHICITGDTFVPTGDVCDSDPCPPADPPHLCIGRPDYVFNSITSTAAVACETLELAASTFAGSVDVTGERKYLGDVLLDISSDADQGSTFEVSLIPGTDNSFLRDGSAVGIPVQLSAPCVLTVADSSTYDKNRYISFRPVEPGSVAYKVDMVSSLFHPTAVVSGWVGMPDANGIASLQASPLTRVWSEPVVHVTGCDITPVAQFELRASFDGGGSFEPARALRTIPRPGSGKYWGDTVGFFDGTEWTAPQGITNIDDALAAIKTWQQAAGAPEIPRTDVEPQEPNRLVNFNDVFVIVQAFIGDSYPYGCPDDPCQDTTVTPCP